LFGLFVGIGLPTNKALGLQSKGFVVVRISHTRDSWKEGSYALLYFYAIGQQVSSRYAIPDDTMGEKPTDKASTQGSGSFSHRLLEHQ